MIHLSYLQAVTRKIGACNLLLEIARLSYFERTTATQLLKSMQKAFSRQGLQQRQRTIKQYARKEACMPEYIDIYDADRNKTGLVLPRKGTKLAQNQYQLYATAICQASDGRYLITQRALDKTWAAGWWEVSGGGALSGEDSLQAAIRETREEVGLDVSAITPDLLYSYCNTDLERGDNYFMDIYLFRFDFSEQDVVLQETEAIGCTLATWKEICELAAEGRFLHFERIERALCQIPEQA